MKSENRKQELVNEFLKALQSISTSLAAGFSCENAFEEASNDMKRLFGGQSLIVNELELISRKVHMGIRIEDALFDFAKRTENEYIEDFALIFAVARQSGTGFAKAISSCVILMQANKQTENEAKVLIRGKQYEQRIMSIIPVGIILYLRLTSESFISKLYHNPTGICVMTICLFVYVLSVIMAESICKVAI